MLGVEKRRSEGYGSLGVCVCVKESWWWSGCMTYMGVHRKDR